jgi:hypothetical protein
MRTSIAPSSTAASPRRSWFRTSSRIACRAVASHGGSSASPSTIRRFSRAASEEAVMVWRGARSAAQPHEAGQSAGRPQPLSHPSPPPPSRKPSRSDRARSRSQAHENGHRAQRCSALLRASRMRKAASQAAAKTSIVVRSGGRVVRKRRDYSARGAPLQPACRPGSGFPI